MPIAQILQSLKGTCRFCRQQAGLLQRDHQDCQETHRSGWQEMVQLAAQAASAHTFNEAALRQTLQAIANRSRATGVKGGEIMYHLGGRALRCGV